MSVSLDLGGGTTVYTEDNTHLIDVLDKGMVEAQNVVQGDKICNVAGEPHNEVMSAPVIT
jgi:hypothetical protein